MSITAHPDLFGPVQLGPLTLRNRIVMAPMTRSRTVAGGVPTPMTAEYYKQRASVGLIISEATNISPQGMGYAYTPGIFNEAQVAGWRLVTDAVHAAGGLIFNQLWHVGRMSHPSFQPGGALPVAPSAVTPRTQVFTENGFEPCVTPRALEREEIAGVIGQFRQAADAARSAGFDGVEILAGGGYLIDQFLKDKTNRRTDDYGGSIPNRARFMMEAVEAVVDAWSPDRVGIRISPIGTVGDIAESSPEALFAHVVRELNRVGVAYLNVMEGPTPGSRDGVSNFDYQVLRRIFNGLYIANNSYTLDMAIRALEENHTDLIAFGRPLISNPDLVQRFRTGAPLAIPDPATIYSGGAQGYTDYPALASAAE